MSFGQPAAHQMNDGGMAVLQLMQQFGAQQQHRPDPAFFFEPGKFTNSGQRVEKTISRGWRQWGGVYPDAKAVGIRARAMILNYYLPELPVSILVNVCEGNPEIIDFLYYLYFHQLPNEKTQGMPFDWCADPFSCGASAANAGTTRQAGRCESARRHRVFIKCDGARIGEWLQVAL